MGRNLEEHLQMVRRLSSPTDRIQDHYTVVVIGSGYGGGIAASRLARAGQSVCVLERGREFQPGEYPDTEPEALANMQVDLPEKHVGPHTGLYDFRVNPDINVFLGCGLGGTSLINANVVVRAEPRVFQDACWPEPLRQDLNAGLEDGYRRAEEMLKPQQLPEEFPKPLKLEALERSAKHLNAKCYRAPIAVTFRDGANHVGVEQKACVGCGDCVTGCNYHAKNTTLMNYLPDAVNHGAEIYTQVAVRRVARDGSRWRVFYQLADAGREKFDAPEMSVTADVVMLGAGSLGSTEILLRSAAAGLSVSAELGRHFTGNGDVLGFGYNTDTAVNGVGFGHNSPQGRAKVGPTITGIIDLRDQPELNNGMIMEEGAIPGALGKFLPVGFAGAARTSQLRPEFNPAKLIREAGREAESLALGPYRGAVRNTQTYLVMTHDDAAGRMYLEDDRLRIDWPGVGRQAIFLKVNEKLADASQPLGGVYLHNPTWTSLLRHNLATVHPLGGCVMSDTAEKGVVNHKGQVFASTTGATVHEGLYVCDGAVLPRSVGINPLLTISAVAERSVALAASDRGWKIDYTLPSMAAKAAAASITPGVQFTETMRGDFEPSAGGETPFEFTLTIATKDVDKMISDPDHKAEMTGTATAPALSGAPMTVHDGEFQLFVENREQVDTRNMIYRMRLASQEGKNYWFYGFKVVRQDSPFDIWPDTSTLYITVREGDANGPVLGKGVLRIRPDDFAKQLTTMHATNCSDPKKRLEVVARFGRFFAGTLWDTYGAVFARPTAFDPDAPPRKKRALRTGAPEIHAFETSDGVKLRLTRYQGGDKGPVVLSHGLGVSSLIFSIDTIDTNLLEYLYAHGYDVWLLDYRASIELPAAMQASDGDAIATKDYPAAVAKIREVTGAAAIQVVAHCWGSTTFVMAMLAGLEGVHSAVCSQIGAHVVAPTMTKLKTGLHVPDFLDALGIETLTAYVDKHANWRDRIFDGALKLYPTQAEERCNSATCHRISFLYAPLYEHDQLNEATHDALHEMFGVAHIRHFEHIARITRKGHLVSAGGEDIYLPNVNRLAIPIAFVHGAENECFLTESTRRTYEWLRNNNGKQLYTRRVIPTYGHIDCIFGKNAAHDVYPFILEHLEATQPRPSTSVASASAKQR
jgi:cholesterol oxidase